MNKHLKKLYSGLCCLLAVFLAACGGNSGGPGGGGSSSGSGNQDGMLSVRDDINELGDNVDNMPYIGETEESKRKDENNGEYPDKGEKAQRARAKNRAFTNKDIIEEGTFPTNPDSSQQGGNWGTNIVYSIDAASPEDDIFYQDYMESRAYGAPSAELMYIGGANNILDYDVKYVKEEVFIHVKMLNRWIRITDSTMRRMRYDQANNILYCEELMTYEDAISGQYFHYQCTTSSYTPEGKEIIEFVCVREPKFGDSKYAKYYRYVEDKEQLFFQVHDEDMYGVVYSDLSQETPITTAFNFAKENLDGRLHEQVTTEIFIPQTETDCGFAAHITTEMWDGQIGYSGFQQRIIDSIGREIGFINADNEGEATLALLLPYVKNVDYTINFTDGLDLNRWEEDWEYRNAITEFNYLANNVSYDISLGDKSFTASGHGGDGIAQGLPFSATTVMFHAQGIYFSVDDQTQLITSLENSGLGIDEKCLAQAARFLTRNEFLASHSMYGYTLDTTVTPELVKSIFYRYMDTFSHVSEEELLSYKLADALPAEQQTEDEQYYAIYNASFTGNVAFDETEQRVDISGVVATMPENLALNSGETLALVAVYSSGCDNQEVARKEFTYNKADLTMAFDAGTKVGIPEVNGEGQFKFFIINLNNQSMRVSSVYVPGCNGDVDKLLVGTNSIKRLFVEDGAFFVRQASPFTVSISVNGQTVASPVRFLQADGAFLSGDYAVVTVKNGDAQVAEFRYEFGKNINPESVTLDSGVNTETLVYSLSIYNEDDEVIYSATLN